MKKSCFENFIMSLCVILAICSIAIGITSCCNFTMSNVMTEGTASDVIDDTPSIKSDPVITPNFNVPAI